MTHRKAICKRCRKEWNISVTRDTTKGYLCPICAYKERRAKGDKDST